MSSFCCMIFYSCSEQLDPSPRSNNNGQSIVKNVLCVCRRFYRVCLSNESNVIVHDIHDVSLDRLRDTACTKLKARRATFVERNSSWYVHTSRKLILSKKSSWPYASFLFSRLFRFFCFFFFYSCLNQTMFSRVVTMRVENGWASSWRRRWRWRVRARWWRWMGLLRGRQYLGIVSLFADFILQGGGWSADEIFQFIRRQHCEVSVCKKIFSNVTTAFYSLIIKSFLFVSHKLQTLSFNPYSNIKG